MTNKIKVGITHGDTNGIGWEIILKAFANEELFDLCTPIVYGSEKVANYYRKTIEESARWHRVENVQQIENGRLNLIDVVGDTDVKIEPGVPSAEAGRMAYLALEAAVADAQKGELDVLLTCPIHKQNIQSSQFSFPGHTEYLESAFEGKALMLLMNRTMRVALATTHVPVSQVSEQITEERLTQQLQSIYDSLRRDFCISSPRIAVLSLNPHCGDGGVTGNEDAQLIRPLIARLNGEGMPCFGPYSADGFFGAGSYRHFDAVLAMYHDQGLAPFKALSMGEGVNFTAGLNIVRTSPDHGTAYDIAGKNRASISSFLQALYTGIDIFRHRVCHDESTANPLPIRPPQRREQRKSFS